MFAVISTDGTGEAFARSPCRRRLAASIFTLNWQPWSTKLIRQAWRTIALACVTECFPDDVGHHRQGVNRHRRLSGHDADDAPAATGNLIIHGTWF